jgi:hypothetical protein
MRNASNGCESWVASPPNCGPPWDRQKGRESLHLVGHCDIDECVLRADLALPCRVLRSASSPN